MARAWSAVLLLAIIPTSAVLMQEVEEDNLRSEDTRFNSVPESEISGPDMIRLYDGVEMPGPVPEAAGAAWAFQQQRVYKASCKVNDTTGYVYMIKDPRMKPFLLPKSTTSNKSRAAVIIAPGGGFDFLNWEREGVSVAKWINSLGMSAFVLAHRAPTNAKGLLMDAERAVSLVRHNAESYDIDSSRIVYLEFAGRTSADISIARKRVYKGVDAVDFTPFNPNFAMLIYGRGPNMYPWTPKPPPTFIVTVQDDPCNEENKKVINYCSNFPSKKEVCEHHHYKTGGHGIGTCDLYKNSWSKGEEACQWTAAAKEWFQKHDLI